MPYTVQRPIEIGHRVRHRRDKRQALVVGIAETIGNRHVLVPVTIEASTRTEYWPAGLIEPLPSSDQFPAHGGRFRAPTGYPLYA